MDWSHSWQVVAYAPPLLVAAAVLLALSLYLARRHDVRERLPEANVAALLLAAAGVWMGAYGLELLRTDYATKVLLNRVAYFGSATLPVLWYEYVRIHVGGAEAVSRRRRLALWTVPAVTLALVLTNGWHSLVWKQVYLDDAMGFVSLVNDHGPAFYAFFLYAYVLILIGMSRLVAVARETSGTRQTQEVTLLVGAALPAVGGAIYAAPWNPFPQVNFPAVAFAAAAGTVAWSVVRHGLFTVVPVGWRAVVEQLDEAAIVLDEAGHVLAYNPAAEAYMSRDPVTTYGADGRAVLHPTVATAAWPPDGDGPTPDGGTVTTRSIERIGEGVRHVEIRRSPLRDRGRRTGSVVVVRDVTDRRRREMRLQAQNERLDKFASVVSHDLRNPLSVARGYAELARETGEDDHFERIDEAHDRIERIVTDLLVLAREGDVLGETEPVVLSAAAESAWQSVDVGGDAEDDGGTPTLVVSDEATFEADPDRLRHLFENLFRNAVEHGARRASGRSAPGDSVEHGSTSSRQTANDAVEHGSTGDTTGSGALTVDVGVLPDGGFYVADDGPGIPASVRERVFERGFSTDEGTGLGLTIVEEIATAHGWEPSVDESAAGGARFEFTPVSE
jgi:signal transduction histidine kinase